MIAFLRGKFLSKSPAIVVMDIHDVGYEVNISLCTYEAIADKEEALLYTYLHITENAQTLFGFYALEEKELFLQLISVSGVGASTARMMLSGLQPEEIVRAIVQQNVKQLERIKGIGKKTAERLIVELKDKLARKHNDAVATSMATSNNSTDSFLQTDAMEALMALGINRSVAENAVKKAIKEAPHAKLEELIKSALKSI